MDKALILLAHGSRPKLAQPFEALTAASRKHPGRRIELAFMELTAPSLDEMLNTFATDGVSEVEVLPIFLQQGVAKRDVPNQIEAFTKTNSMGVTLREPVGAWPKFGIRSPKRLGSSSSLLNHAVNRWGFTDQPPLERALRHRPRHETWPPEDDLMVR